MFILILGLGRTGKNLAKLALADGHHVAGTTQKPDQNLLDMGVIPIIWSSKDGTHCLPDADRVVCAFPPTDLYPVQLAALFSRYPTTPIIQISSSGVFGRNIGLITEETQPIPNDSRSNLLYQAEIEVLTQPNGYIVRAAGLYDDENHPIHFISGKKNIKNPDGNINLVHREDLAEIIYEIILEDQPEKITHAANPNHPTRKEYYEEKAKHLNLPPPEFSNEQKVEKIITSRLQKNWREL